VIILFDAIYRLVLFFGFICLAYLLGKKNQYDKGYNKGFDSGYESGYDDGESAILKQIYGTKKK
jgi:hypothetical protein